tara:strand:+ start:8942 stop:9265 length:324 start_codon:yes stop_codon:yes gene_type:complete
MSNSRVWAIQEGNNNYEAAEAFGEVRFVTRFELQPMANSQQNLNVIGDIRKFNSEYLIGTDYIIPSGNPMVTAQLLLTLGRGKHHFLKWDGRRGIYIPFTLDSEATV